MSKIKQTLWTDYDAVKTKIEQATTGDENYKLLLEERDKLRNELIKLDQAEIEADLKKYQTDSESKVKSAQIEAENKREKVRNRITIGTFAVTTAVSIYAIVKTFRFDQDSTITSTMGRNILNGFIPKLFKR